MSWGNREVMTTTPPRVRVQDTSTEDPIRVLVLEEFRDRARRSTVDEHQDRRDVATLRALHAGETTEIDAGQHAALEPLVASWAVPKHYGLRITERSQNSPSSLQLAVTESGITQSEHPWGRTRVSWFSLVAMTIQDRSAAIHRDGHSLGVCGRSGRK
jgi:hypothetical protein